MAPKKVIKAAPKKAAPPTPAPKKAAEKDKKAASNAKKNSKAEEEDAMSETHSSPGRRVTGRREENEKESPSEAASRSMRVAGSPAGSAGKPSPVKSTLAVSKTKRLNVSLDEPQGSSVSALEQGLVKLRRDGRLCDVNIISGFGRIPAHRTVLAAHSEKLAERFKDQLITELDLQPASHEAVEIVVRWTYGEVSADNFQPTTPKVNEEVLRISFEFGLPLLSELCAARLAETVDTSNAVPSVRLCEEYGLPKLRAAIVKAIVEDSFALDAVAKDPTTLSHPGLMRELLASIAQAA